MGRSVSPLPYRNNETGIGLAADAAEDPLSFDVVTAIVLRFAKNGPRKQVDPPGRVN